MQMELARRSQTKCTWNFTRSSSPITLMPHDVCVCVCVWMWNTVEIEPIASDDIHLKRDLTATPIDLKSDTLKA